MKALDCSPGTVISISSTPPDLDGHSDLRCTGIDGIFQQLLDHRRGPLNDLTGGDQFLP
ncbi:hypothetical protein [Faecalibacterium hattorii]|uniref:hypothetical protein n=1 Tax=Faecalibacterium hattorii TaxID=2935520 RepID=UPI003AAF0D7C